MIFHRLWQCVVLNISRSYLSVSMIRKYIFTALVIIWGQQDGPDAVIWLFILQLIYLIYLAFVRPFRNFIDNFIEISLESIYFIILALMMIETQYNQNFELEQALPILLLILWFSKKILYIIWNYSMDMDWFLAIVSKKSGN